MSEPNVFKTPSLEALSNIKEVKSNYTKEEFLSDSSKIIAFYLPQYHEVAENSEWWGQGFTDWVNVAKARKLFKDHYQPQIPEELGFYDLSNVSVIERQAQLAKSHDVFGFCFYWYWFNGRKILEAPIQLLRESDIDINYCVMWANDSWARTWDHNPKELLIEQTYPEGFEIPFINDLLDHWRDDRYIKVDGRPLLLIYRVLNFPNPNAILKNLRDASIRSFGEDPFIVGVDFYDIDSSATFGLDALVEFPPHKFWSAGNQLSLPETISEEFSGHIVDYKKVMMQSITRILPQNIKIFRTLVPAWDNSPRLGNRSVIIQNTDPKLFGRWLAALRQSARENHTKNENFIFINAWNEWAEGAHLEPDLLNRRAFLEQILITKQYPKNHNFADLNDLEMLLNIESRQKQTQAYFSAAYYQSSSSRIRKLGNHLYGFSPYLYRFLRLLFVTVLNLRNRQQFRRALVNFIFNLSPPVYRLLRSRFRRVKSRSRV
jgi:hypothetical protein